MTADDMRTRLDSIIAYQTNADRHHLFRRRLGRDVPARVRDLWLVPMGVGNLRISLSPVGDEVTISSNYCFHDHERAWHAALHWDGHGDPFGWIRHIESGRRQEFSLDGELVREWWQP